MRVFQFVQSHFYCMHAAPYSKKRPLDLLTIKHSLVATLVATLVLEPNLTLSDRIDFSRLKLFVTIKSMFSFSLFV